MTSVLAISMLHWWSQEIATKTLYHHWLWLPVLWSKDVHVQICTNTQNTSRSTCILYSNCEQLWSSNCDTHASARRAREPLKRFWETWQREEKHHELESSETQRMSRPGKIDLRPGWHHSQFVVYLSCDPSTPLHNGRFRGWKVLKSTVTEYARSFEQNPTLPWGESTLKVELALTKASLLLCACRGSTCNFEHTVTKISQYLNVCYYSVFVILNTYSIWFLLRGTHNKVSWYHGSLLRLIHAVCYVVSVMSYTERSPPCPLGYW